MSEFDFNRTFLYAFADCVWLLTASVNFVIVAESLAFPRLLNLSLLNTFRCVMTFRVIEFLRRSYIFLDSFISRCEKSENERQKQLYIICLKTSLSLKFNCSGVRIDWSPFTALSIHYRALCNPKSFAVFHFNNSQRL